MSNFWAIIEGENSNSNEDQVVVSSYNLLTYVENIAVLPGQ